MVLSRFTTVTSSIGTFSVIRTENTEDFVEVPEKPTSTLVTDGSVTIMPVNEDYTTPTDVTPYIREQTIHFYGTGLRPGSRVWPYFDRVAISSYCEPAIVDAADVVEPANFRTLGDFGDPLVVDSKGQVFGLFAIPRATFLTGTLEFLLVDVDNLANIATATTIASSQFSAFYNVTSTTTGVTATDSSGRTVAYSNTATREIVGNFLPLSQSFFISNEIADGKEGIYAKQVDLYFRQKDPNLGIAIELRTVENGLPTTTTITNSRVYLQSSQVNTSTNGSVGTSFVFNNPVFLTSDREYCISIIPDGPSPDYQIFTGVTGRADLADSTKIMSKSWSDGTLYLATNGTNWTPLQDEDLKFTLWRAEFAEAPIETPVTATLVNNAQEFLTLTDITGTFAQDEMLFANTANATGTVTTNVDSFALVGSGTTFTTQYEAGDYIVILSGGANNDVIPIRSVTNNTNLVLQNKPKFSGSGLSHLITVVGKVSEFNGNKESTQMVLYESTARTGFTFQANTVIYGQRSGATATIDSIDDLNVSYFKPLVDRTVVQDTNLTVSTTFTKPDYSAQDKKSLSFGTRHIATQSTIIASRSNEITEMDGEASLKFDLELSSTDTRLSPQINPDNTALIIYRYIVNNDSTNEHTNSGSAKAKYISKTVTLADGMDAEDIRVLVTAYRPTTTDIEVYAKIKSNLDPDFFNDKNWTKLEMLTPSNLYSDNSIYNNFKEYEFAFPTFPITSALTGVVSITAGNNEITGSETLFESELSAGDYIKINEDPGATLYQIAQVDTITSNTVMTIYEPASFTNPGTTIEKVTYPQMAFKNPQNDGIVRYYDDSGAVYDTYKIFAIKIVMKAESETLVPRILDIRAIATSV